MKNKIFKISIFLLAAISVLSCTSLVENQNEDPDRLTNADAKNIFQGVLLANQFFQTSSTNRHAMIWLNQATGENRQYVALNDWNNSVAADFDDTWNSAYVNVITQAKLLQQKASDEVAPRLKGVGQVIEAHCMGTITSLWGDVPFSEIKIDGSNLTPKFDKQADVYAGVQNLLNQAILNLNTNVGASISPEKDVYFQGVTSKWIKLAYSLKARFYLHTKQYALAKSNALLGINTDAGDFRTVFGSTGSTQDFNPYYSFLVYDRDDYMSGDGYAGKLLDPSSALYRGNSKTDESARYAFTYNTDYFAPYSMNVNGADYGGTTARFGNDAKMPMVTYGEMLLIIAEVDARTDFVAGLTSYNNYRSLLNTGYSVKYDLESFSYLPYTSADFATGGIENFNPGTTNQSALLREIYQERYVYFLGNYECFNDFGRTNNGGGIVLKTGYTGTPQRFIYPQVEVNSNPNTPSPLPRITVKTPVHM